MRGERGIHLRVRESTAGCGQRSGVRSKKIKILYFLETLLTARLVRGIHIEREPVPYNFGIQLFPIGLGPMPAIRKIKRRNHVSRYSRERNVNACKTGVKHRSNLQPCATYLKQCFFYNRTVMEIYLFFSCKWYPILINRWVDNRLMIIKVLPRCYQHPGAWS